MGRVYAYTRDHFKVSRRIRRQISRRPRCLRSEAMYMKRTNLIGNFNGGGPARATTFQLILDLLLSLTKMPNDLEQSLPSSMDSGNATRSSQSYAEPQGVRSHFCVFRAQAVVDGPCRQWSIVRVCKTTPQVPPSVPAPASMNKAWKSTSCWVYKEV